LSVITSQYQVTHHNNLYAYNFPAFVHTTISMSTHYLIMMTLSNAQKPNHKEDNPSQGGIYFDVKCHRMGRSQQSCGSLLWHTHHFLVCK